MHADTLEAIRRSAAIPSMPLVATRCFEMTQDPNCNYDRLVELLSTDPGIAAEILRLSNSALFGVPRKVTALKQAVTLLGIKRLRDLVLTRYLVQRLDQSRKGLIDINYFWRRSLTRAVVASRLAEAAQPRHREEAFIGGLLAHVGVVVLAQAVPTAYKPIAEQYKPLGGRDWIAGEYNLLGVTHGEVSAMVLEDWSLPNEVTDAVRHQQTPADQLAADAPGRFVAPILGAADAIAALLCEAGNPQHAAEICIAAADRVHLSPAVLAQMLPLIEQDVEALAAMLRVDVIPNKVFSLIASQIVAQMSAPASA